jgi:aspartyl-tRNA(Asn)/glutamyl-tRNA(Gln) amidotransferase subunit A
MDLAGILYTAETYGTWGKVIEANPEVVFGPVRERFRAGDAHKASDYVIAWRRLAELRAQYAALTAGYDAVLIPTAPTLPPVIAELMADHAYFTAINLKTLRNTRIGNLMGGCSLTLPTGVPMTGIMLMANPGEEARLLRLGAAAEVALKD